MQNALVQVKEDFEGIDDGSDPYLATKSILLRRYVPMPSVRLETMAQANSQLVFSPNHTSLATCAKLGGIPWLLASQQTAGCLRYPRFRQAADGPYRAGGKLRQSGLWESACATGPSVSPAPASSDGLQMIRSPATNCTSTMLQMSRIASRHIALVARINCKMDFADEVSSHSFRPGAF